MAEDEHKTAEAEKVPEAGETSPGVHEGHGADCRCEEAQGKSAREMLKLVLKDFTFWKKD